MKTRLFQFLLWWMPVVGWAQTSPLTIDQALSRVGRANDRIRASLLRQEAAEDRMIRARAAFLPTVSLNGTYTRRPFESKRVVGGDEIVIQSLNALSATANASMPLLNLSLFSRHGQAAHERDASIEEQRLVMRTLAFGAAESFLVAVTARQVREAAERRLAFARENLAAAQARFDAQIASSNDVTRATLELATAELVTTQSANAERSASLQLALFLQSERPDSLVFPESLLSTAMEEPLAPESLTRDALDRRPDLLSLRARRAATDASATEALFRALPSVDLTGQVRVTNEAGFSGKNTNWFVGASVNWNLLDGGLWWGDRQERRALAQALDAEVSALERQVASEVEDAALRVINARAAVRQAATAADLAKRNAAESAERYRYGLSGALESADANVRLFEAETVLSQQRAALLLAWFDVRQACGLPPLDDEGTRP